MRLDDKFIVERFKVIDKRDTVSIVLFPDVPYWIATNNQGISFLEKLDGSKTVEEISSEVLGKGMSQVAEEFLEPLIASHVIYYSGNRNNSKKLNVDGVKPDKVTLVQTMKCNLKCRHCAVSEHTENSQQLDLSYDKMKVVIDNVEKIIGPYKGLSFLGGEPLLGDRFLDVLEYASKKGFKLGFSTNGMLIDQEFCEKAKLMDVHVQVSVDGPNKTAHEAIRGKGTWDKVNSSIDLLLKNENRIQTNMVFHKSNINMIPEYIKWGKERGIKDLRLTPLMSKGNAVGNLEYSNLEEMVDVLIAMVNEDPSIISYLQETQFVGLIVNARLSSKMIGCGSGVITVTIDPKGYVYPCMNTYVDEFRMCNIFDESFVHDFENSHVRKEFGQLRVDELNSQCSECDFKYVCGGLCRGETHSTTGNLKDPHPYCASWKKAMTKIYWLLVDNPSIGKEKTERVVANLENYSFTC